MKLFVLLVAAAILIGCGAEGDSESEFESSVQIGVSQNLSSFSPKIELSSDTPEGLGTLLVIHDGDISTRKLSACTWSLIDQEYALTNSHCIPDALKVNPKINCNDYIQGKISDGKGQAVDVSCIEVVSFSELGSSVVKDNDYALIKINKVHIKPFNFSRVGVSEKESFTARTMDHDVSLKRIVSTYNPKECVAESSDILGVIKSSGSSPVTLFESCKVIGGNSGSPVTNSAGDVVGVVHGGVKDQASLAKALEKKNMKVLLSSDIGIMTNLRCFKLGHIKFDAEVDESCSIDNSSDGIEHLEDKIKTIYLEKIAKQKSKLPAFVTFEETLKEYGEAQLLDFKPKCVQAIEQWSDTDRASIKRKGLFNKTISFSISRYSMKPVVSIDFYGNFDIDLVMTYNAQTKYALSHLEKLNKDKKVSATSTAKLLTRNIEYSIEIPKCSTNLN